MRELGNEPARALTDVKRQLDVAEPCAALGALPAQVFEPAHAAFVARPARFDPLADPGLLLRPELVELPMRDGFGASSSAFRDS
jgi:hypothetical protein